MKLMEIVERSPDLQIGDAETWTRDLAVRAKRLLGQSCTDRQLAYLAVEMNVMEPFDNAAMYGLAGDARRTELLRLVDLVSPRTLASAYAVMVRATSKWSRGSLDDERLFFKSDFERMRIWLRSRGQRVGSRGAIRSSAIEEFWSEVERRGGRV